MLKKHLTCYIKFLINEKNFNYWWRRFYWYKCCLYFQKKNYQIFILDNLSRKGTKFNIYKLNKLKNINFIKADIRIKKNL